MFRESANVVRRGWQRWDDIRGGCDVRGLLGEAMIDALPFLVAFLFACRAVARAAQGDA